jgi:O-antigen/teichoic acid export membrane protein
MKNVIMISGGTASAQLMGILLLPLITRLYTPEQYGVIAVYTAVLVWVNFLGSMNYEMGVPIADSNEKAINVLFLSIITLCFFNMVLVFFFTLYGNDILRLLNGEILIKYKYLIPLGAFLLGLYNIFSQWAYRNRDYKAITRTKFSQALSQNLVTIGFGLLGKGEVGLILGRIFGQSTGVSTLSYPIIKEDKSLLKMINKHDVIFVAKRYVNYPLYTTPRRFLGDISITLPIILITSFYGTQAVGLFGLANSVIQLPMNLIGTSVSNVFYAESASLKRTDPRKVKKLSRKLLKNLILIGSIPLLVLIFLGPLLFSFVFGNEWNEAGVYASLLSIGVFSRLVFKPISNIFDIYEKQKLSLLINILSIILVTAAFACSKSMNLNSYWAVGLYSVALAIVYFFQYLLAQKIMSEEIVMFDKKNIYTS